MREHARVMGQPVVHVEIIGTDPAALREFYGELFGWEFDTGGIVSDAVSIPDDYGFVTPPAGAAAAAGGIGGGPEFAPHVLFYVGVDDVEAALRKAERLGGTRVLGPAQPPGRPLVVGQFTDPEGNLIGVAGGA
jgi:predicted enzyme related to lactoylglutathione lyase